MVEIEIADADDGHGRENAFDEHAAVADGQDVAFLRDLLGGGSGSDDGMEAGACAAGDGHEQQREEIRRNLAFAGERGHVERGMVEGDAEEPEQHHHIKQIGVEIVARLEEHPDGQDGRAEGVDEQHDGPDVRGGRLAAAGDFHEVERNHRAQPDADEEQRHEDAGANGQRKDLLVRQDAENRRDENEQDGGGGDGGRRHEGRRDLRREDGHDENQRGDAEEQEDLAAGVAKLFFNNVCDGAAVVADGEEHGREVVHGSDEDASEHDPHHGGPPAEIGGEHGADDRAGARDGGEMVAEQDAQRRGNVVDAVFFRFRRTRAGRIDSERPLQESPVAEIREQKQDDDA